MKHRQTDWLILSNPESGRRFANRGRFLLERSLAERGSTFATIEEDSLSAALTSLTSALRESLPLRGVIVLGGDGTVHHAVNAVQGISKDIPFAVVPSGTGNDFALQCGLTDLSINQIVELIYSKVAEEIDLIAVNDRYCLQVLSTGFDAEVSARSARLPQRLGNLRYLLALFVELLTLRPIEYELTVGGKRRRVSAIMVSFANGRNYGGGMLISPNSDHQDGVGEIIIIHPVKRLALLRVFPLIYSGRHLSHPAVEIVPATDLKMKGSTIAQGDGEAVAEKAIDLQIELRRARFWKV